jgi:DNA-binding MurR/RpiR family transcriptional regulator
LLKANLTPSEVRLARVVLADYPQSALATAAGLASTADTSQATVTRFVSKIGYDSFPEFQEEVRDEVRSRLASPSSRLKLPSGSTKKRPGKSLLEAVRLDIENLHETAELVDPAAFEAWVDQLVKKDGNVFVAGSKKAASIAAYFAAQLNQLRPRVHLLPLADTLPDQIVDLTRADVLVAFEPRRATVQLERLVNAFRQAGATVVAVCDEYPAPALARSPILICVATRGVNLFDSYTAIVSVINGVLASAVPRMPTTAVPRVDRLEALNRDFEMWSDRNELRQDRPRNGKRS